ncbi:hypothetical protein ACFLUF_03185, partial [Chloroflexota bacterium]
MDFAITDDGVQLSLKNNAGKQIIVDSVAILTEKAELTGCTSTILNSAWDPEDIKNVVITCTNFEEAGLVEGEKKKLKIKLTYHKAGSDSIFSKVVQGEVFGVVGSGSVSPPGPDTTPPVRSNGQPTGTLLSGTTETTISLTTDEAATCKYDIAAGVDYDLMSNTFSTTDSTSHSTLVTGLIDGITYNYYVRCQDLAAPPNTNPDDFTISFSVSIGG